MYKLLGVLFLFVAATCWAKPTLKSSAVSFIATGNPGFLTVEGVGAKLQGLDLVVKGSKISGSVWVDLTKLTTDMDLRDSHMHEKYLESQKFPKAKLVFNGEKGRFGGDLTIKKVTRMVSGEYTLIGKKFTANFEILLTDYPIGVPSWLGVTVAEKVEIKVKGEL